MLGLIVTASKTFTKISHSKLYLLLAFISLIFLTYGLLQIKPLTVNPGELLGVVAHLPLSYWIGLGLILCCSIFAYLDGNVKNDCVFVTISVILGLFLFLIIQVGELSSQYYPSAEVKTILTTGHIYMQAPYPSLSYHMWPAIHFISASLVYATGFDIGNLIRYMPLIWVVGFNLILFTLGKRLGFSSNQAFLLSCLGLAALWPYSGPSYHPTWLALVPYVLLFMLLASPSDIAAEKITIILTFAMLLLTHGLTALATVLMASTLLIYNLIRKRRDGILIALFVVTFAAWYIYVVTPMFEFGLRSYVASASSLDFQHLVGSQYSGGESPPARLQFISFTYIFAAAILFFAFFLSATSYLLGWCDIEKKKNVEACFFWILGIIPILVLQYGFEISFRIYLLTSIPILCMLISAIPQKVVIVIFFVLLTLIHIPASFNGESPGFLTENTELKGAEFFTQRIEPQEPYLYRNASLIWFYNPDLIDVPSLTFWRTVDPALFDKVEYVIDSRQNHSYLVLHFGRDPVREWLQKEENRTDKLYANGYFNLYQIR